MKRNENRMKNKDLKRRILDLSFKYKLSHIGSCLTAVDIIDEIYSKKKPDEKFVLSSGHAGLALYVVIEKYEHIDAEKIWLHHGVHPDRCKECHIDCSTGSLGNGLPIAVGMALASRRVDFESNIGIGTVEKNVYCLISDGEMAEGSIWESLRIAGQQALSNLHIYVNYNGYSAYDRTDYNFLKDKFSYETVDPFHEFDFTLDVQWRKTTMKGWPEWLQGQAAHYVTMDEKMYQEALEMVK